ncbi:chitin synthase chs-2-like [Saccostrea echinata]|uniref:chitin synthase chs-2-like n=1 Tax=Saccostrea echinata TaxID=191078 RepID=UPI002A83CF97|nr:chitin synthase chs-2-like [Saccostrea echinata]
MGQVTVESLDIVVANYPWNSWDHGKYHWKHFDTRLPPHIFNVANRAYRRMCQTDGNQTIIFCGESGAGKTENTKYLVQHLMHTCICDQGIEELKSKILKLDVVLESFGNARTKINSNASRFARLLQISFRDEKLIGANVRHVMLDKNRVVARTENCKEGNFHIFYALCEGLSAEEKQKFHLQRKEVYTILLGSNEDLHEKEKYLKQYHDIKKGLDNFAVSPYEFIFLTKMLAAILLLSEITFVKPVREVDKIKVKNEEKLEQVAELMSVKSDDLKKGLLLKTFSAGDKIPHNTVQDAEIRRDTLAKHTYERLFGNQEEANIGILDMPGFENLQVNRFEQMCINLLYDKLQIFMFDKIIESEKEIYEDENIDPDLLAIKIENENIVDIFENKMIGIWSTLCTESSPPYGRDQHLVVRLQWNLRDHTPQLIEFRQRCPTEFCIKHHAGEESVNELIRELERSTTHFVRCIKPNEDPKSSSFDKVVVRKQLRYSGILQMAKLRNHGLSVEITIKNFMERYINLIPDLHAEPTREDVESLLQNALPSEMQDCFQVRDHKVFLKEEVDMYMEKELIKIRRKCEDKTVRQNRRSGRQLKFKKREIQENEVIAAGSDLENEDNEQTNVKYYHSNDNATDTENNEVSVIPILLLPKTDLLPETLQTAIAKYERGMPGVFEDISYNSFMYIKVFAAFLFTSLSWWENFAADKGCFSKIFQRGINKVKYELQESRPYFGIIVSLTKIAMTVLSASLLVGDQTELLNSEFWSTITNYDNVGFFSDIIALVISGFVGYYVAYTACKLRMQIFSFSIPCLISTPIFITLMAYYCDDSESILSVISSINIDIACEHNHEIANNWLHLTVTAAWLLSMYWIGQHIWFPSQERIAKIERLFVNPLYCGILMEQHLVMNRRRLVREIPNMEKTNIKKEEDSDTRKNIIGQEEHHSEEERYRQFFIKVRVTEGDHFTFLFLVILYKNLSERTENIYPRVFACATLWHETLNEMKQLLKSLYRVDKDQSGRKEGDQDYYEFEAHILFDDAFQKNDVNDFVKNFASVMNETVSAVHAKATKLEKPVIICTVYGAQIVYKMPGGNLMFIHLKDKTKIRNKKRWSQVMYMYYLLAYRLSIETIEMQTHRESKKTFEELLKPRANNTFLLALDGDVDFSPGSLRILVDRMRKEDRVGASCGRIHPIGSGPIVWYQKFEYAVAHWLQKATEHVLGCVLCSPGCFSLFRGFALMDDNVMNKYTQLPTEASHHLMYDQGEDRWLCTLLLQQGYRVDYAAGADAFTYAPEGFNEYFKQRKRWGPSTLANIMSLLQDCRNTVQANANISWLYIFYQGSLLVATIVGPATILMMIAGAFVAVFKIDLLTSYIASLAPVILFFVICLTCNSNIQLLVAQLLSGIYVIIMIVVLVGVIITAVTESPFHPSVVFLCGIIAIFVIAALFHPREWDNLLFGLLYFVLVPCGFLVLIIYSLCNLNDVSWGTRESGKMKGKDTEKKDIVSKILSPFRKFKGNVSKPYVSEDDVERLVAKLIEGNSHTKDSKTTKDDPDEVVVGREKIKSDKDTIRKQQSVEHERTTDSVNDSEPQWISKGIFKGNRIEMTEKEDDFWKRLIDRYLKPPQRDEAKENEDREKLKELRNNVCAGMAVLNLIWVSINFMFQLRRPTVVTLTKFENGNEIEIDVLGLLFIIFFTLILVLQFCGMLMHRWGTFLHLLAITEIPNPFLKKDDNPKQQDQSSPEEENEDDLTNQIKNLSLIGRRHKGDAEEYIIPMKRRIKEKVRNRKQSQVSSYTD